MSNQTTIDSIEELQTYFEPNLEFKFSQPILFEDIVFNFDLGKNLKSLEDLTDILNFTKLNLFNLIIHYKFINCIFTHEIQIKGAFQKQLTFEKNCVFENGINLNGSQFDKKIRFQNTVFKGICDFENARFEDLIDFWKSDFFNPVQFYKTDFLKTTVFSACTFHENVLFTYALFNGKTFFRGTQFNKGLDLSLSINSGEFNFFNLSLGNFKSYIHNSEEDYMDLLKSNEIPSINKKETFRLLKQYFEKNGDDLEYIKYLKLEKSPIVDILKYEIKNSKLTLNSINKIFEILSIWLNKRSNNHRDSYVRGILFTIIIGFVFFTLTVISLPNYQFEVLPNKWCMNDFGMYFFTFMNPTHNIDLFKDLKPTGFTYFWQTLGRIFIGYGIYQTIQAFRKLK
ncbi:pentapeptide repeat-containing protein [Aquirufa ecclesiirivi]